MEVIKYSNPNIAILSFILGFIACAGYHSSLISGIAYVVVLEHVANACNNNAEDFTAFWPSPNISLTVAILTVLEIVWNYYYSFISLPAFIANLFLLPIILLSIVRFGLLIDDFITYKTIKSYLKLLRDALKNIQIEQALLTVIIACFQLHINNYFTGSFLCYTIWNEWNGNKEKKIVFVKSNSMIERKFYGIFHLPILDHDHTLQNVTLYSFGLGWIFGFGFLIFAYFSFSIYSIGLFLCTLMVFHQMEYVITATYQPDASLTSYLLNHSPEYHFAMLAAAVEYFIEWAFFPWLKQYNDLIYFGLFMVVSGQIMRSTAMITAQSNFTHLVADSKRESHQLVTHGIYSIFRHPSYTGFFYWGIGMQVMLANPICFFLYWYALYTFFSERIETEEQYLIEFFGSEYVEYRKRSLVLIPMIK
ncbi:Isoprenylcysteine carboxyl methyltransferase family-domain-containing protein [Globomyces pollinis-pini]|nr:Isoprenylcysteine carboxyl methyltransferase family-domain-containing protein [Globomyces pollinis-pini]